jgi:hypothetical protein
VLNDVFFMRTEVLVKLPFLSSISYTCFEMVDLRVRVDRYICYKV